MKKRKTMAARREELLARIGGVLHHATASGYREGLRVADPVKWDTKEVQDAQDRAYIAARCAQQECIHLFNAAIRAARSAK